MRPAARIAQAESEEIILKCVFIPSRAGALLREKVAKLAPKWDILLPLGEGGAASAG